MKSSNALLSATPFAAIIFSLSESNISQSGFATIGIIPFLIESAFDVMESTDVAFDNILSVSYFLLIYIVAASTDIGKP